MRQKKRKPCFWTASLSSRLGVAPVSVCTPRDPHVASIPTANDRRRGQAPFLVCPKVGPLLQVRLTGKSILLLGEAGCFQPGPCSLRNKIFFRGINAQKPSSLSPYASLPSDMDVYEHNDATEGPGWPETSLALGAQRTCGMFEAPLLSKCVHPLWSLRTPLLIIHQPQLLRHMHVGKWGFLLLWQVPRTVAASSPVLVARFWASLDPSLDSSPMASMRF